MPLEKRENISGSSTILDVLSDEKASIATLEVHRKEHGKPTPRVKSYKNN